MLAWREASRPIGGAKLARFQGNIHQGSDRAAATLLMVVLVLLVLMFGWYIGDQDGFLTFWDGLLDTITPGR